MGTKVLLLRFSSIGDIVLTSPVIRVLHQQLSAEVHFLTKQKFASILNPNPYLSKIYTINKKVGEVMPQLRAEKYDALIDLHANLRSLQVKWGLSCPAYTFRKLNLQKWLLTNFKWDAMPPVHIVDRYLAAAAPLGVTNDGEGLDYFIPPEEEVPVSQKWPQFRSQRRWIAFGIGAAHATKRLPPDKMLAVCDRLPAPVVLLGGPDMIEAGAWLAEKSSGEVINACGELSLHQSASVLRQAAVVLTHDTGLMHMAAALRRPIVSVWGNTVPAFGMTPYLQQGAPPSRILEVEGLSCRPCSKIGYKRCPKGHFRCMRDLPDADIVAAVEAAL